VTTEEQLQHLHDLIAVAKDGELGYATAAQHVDNARLATIFAEMALSASLSLHRQVNFPLNRTFGSINSSSRSYRNTASATESVLCFAKDA